MSAQNHAKLVSVFDASEGSCARQQPPGNGISWQKYPAIHANCTPVAMPVTDATGAADIVVPPGDYVVISHVDSDGDGVLDEFLGAKAEGVICAEQRRVHLQLIVHTNGNKRPGKIARSSIARRWKHVRTPERGRFILPDSEVVLVDRRLCDRLRRISRGRAGRHAAGVFLRQDLRVRQGGARWQRAR
jgi:hypothetical protein